jgi:hypothetical protein
MSGMYCGPSSHAFLTHISSLHSQLGWGEPLYEECVVVADYIKRLADVEHEFAIR